MWLHIVMASLASWGGSFIVGFKKDSLTCVGFLHMSCHPEKTYHARGFVLLRNSLGIIPPSCIYGLSKAVVIHIWCPDSNFGRKYHAEI